MAKITWTNEAESWLADIHDYISRDNPVAARKIVSEIYRRAQILKDFPQIGHEYRPETEGVVRILLYGHYRIAYLHRMDGDIAILGVFHGALDMDRYIPRR
ncbi:MAG: type II toxin-antitoxin system RelE/ParE family toxin [Burkholderiales bacterium]|nr:type II toxin-antitoxin system RelE/ParE family toxin [Burkholderiales bacterium]